jgi:hypothetical protein
MLLPYSEILDKAGNTQAYYKSYKLQLQKVFKRVDPGCQDTNIFIFLPDKNLKM